MQIELKTLQHKVGITFIFVTHDQEEALTMSDRIAVMKEGEIQQLATPFETYHHPINRFVASFIGNSNILSGKVVSKTNDSISIDTNGGPGRGVSRFGSPISSHHLFFRRCYIFELSDQFVFQNVLRAWVAYCAITAPWFETEKAEKIWC